MVIKLSKYFRVPAAELRLRGVLNAYIGLDNRLFVDPNLLKATKVPDFQNARKDLEEYFAGIIKLLKTSKGSGDVAWVPLLLG